MKIIKKIFVTIIIILICFGAASYLLLRSTKPNYSGKVSLPGLNKKVEIIIDEYGVPHIYAENSHDAYMALGYVQAQERLFQMEMIRRVTSGRLSELLGEKFLNTDKTMLTLSIREAAKKSANKFFNETSAPYKQETLAYLKGINSFIENGTLPIEFTLLNFKPELFKPVDVYTVLGYMSLSFTSALSQEPIVTRILENLGQDYLIDFGLDSISNVQHYLDTTSQTKHLGNLSSEIQKTFNTLPVPVWYGSNNWVLSGIRSKSGKVLLANDTHIRFSQPAVWYEAYIEYPGFSMAGYYLAGVPFAITGHNDRFAWGTTIFPFDNMDLYREKQNPDNPNQIWVNDHWENYNTVINKITVKGGNDVAFEIRSTRHGPILNGVYNNIAKYDEPPISMWWALNKMESAVLEGLYKINNASDMQEFEKAMEYIDLIGMNMIYGDNENNIALWAAGKIPIRPEHVNSKIILDGASGNDEILGYYSFDKNPRIINPEDGFITTSNDEHERVDGILYPGYYSPGIRANRIKRLINSRDKWDIEGLSSIQLDNTSEKDTMLAALILSEANTKKVSSIGPTYALAINQLHSWDGKTDVNSIGATIFSNLVYFIMYNTLGDELNEQDFNSFINSFLVRSRMSALFSNENSIWFDNKTTLNTKELRSDIFTLSLEETISSLSAQLGDDVSTWKWGKVHTLTHIHPIGYEEPLDRIFNIGPFAKSGGNDVIDKEGYRYNKAGVYPVVDGPAMRLLIDFADTDHAWSIIPTGQSGNVMSQHYSDQAHMFNNGKYRIINTNKNELNNERVLILEP
ncbi:MAG: penicillin acylase family protein [Bacteroidetes bacterium]|jgi:penicillin amidase|nr:penicillin acylase family protein [Bacteroidota bacterium]